MPLHHLSKTLFENFPCGWHTLRSGMGLTKRGVMISRHSSRESQHWSYRCRRCRLRRSWSANLRRWRFSQSTSPFSRGSRRFNIELEKKRWRSVEYDIKKGRKEREVGFHVGLWVNQDLMSPPRLHTRRLRVGECTPRVRKVGNHHSKRTRTMTCM